MSHGTVNIRDALLRKVQDGLGKPGGWPADFVYDFLDGCVTMSLRPDLPESKHDKALFRKMDCWSFAFVAEAEKAFGAPVKRMSYVLDARSLLRRDPDFEAFRRRLSYLEINNEQITFDLRLRGEDVPLDDVTTLYARPSCEKIRSDFTDRSDHDKAGRIEKDFQTFLYGKGLDAPIDARTNERLAILGEDFFDLKGKGHGVLREFPTGAFKDKISQKTRILPTEFVDIVTTNKHHQLSVIELKVNDSKLEVISQILDYALFFSCYEEHIRNVLQTKLPNTRLTPGPIVCYVANNRFHPRFEQIERFYGGNTKDRRFALKKVTLGFTTSLAQSS